MTLVSLVYGGSSAARERAIAAAIAPGVPSAAIVEGLPTGEDVLAQAAEAGQLQVFRVAAGCPCCNGNLTMRVTLNRALRQHPQQLYLSLSNGDHKERVLNFLQEPQYLPLLEIGAGMDCS